MKCPLCNSEDTFLVRSIEVERLATAWNRRLNIDVYAEFHGLQRIQLLKCRCCHLLFFAPSFLAGSAQLYTQLDRLDWYYMPRKWEHDVALADLRGARTILEIGCGFGDFIARARTEEGLCVKGIELNESAVEEAQRRGLPVQLLDLQEAAAQFAGHYDAVCAFQVLEHVPNPKDFLEWACALVKPGGKLILGVPNADSFLKYQFNIFDMPPHHMTRWSSETLSYLPELFPLRLEHIKREPLAKHHVGGYVDAYCSVLEKHGAIPNLCHPALKRCLAAFIRRTGLCKLLTGQGLYASFLRV